jgi:hypothetical protein
MRFLQKERPGELPRLLRGYKAERDANLSKDAFYIPPAERQAEILAVFFNEDWPELASARMAAGEADEEIAADASLAALPEKEVLKTKTRTP